ncbi:hypothetical protein BDV38DRAFT_292909 [Aspergillus pseudotamarii]|uniref:Zn(2)-C6 fungal-type domain-containing protein n=1 Tax=Aspergillus pseudotamarii TaxID=132259 RepID=A0A5N6SVP7_ASPPS|nr:uncharacterized protein BDV38DRAFT_292909 [Aspergillus pseudotamarii]KAE8137463.1 hypothetical protein BDV38DRAFT_292909 [Aspergillus pseudotamarii]
MTLSGWFRPPLVPQLVRLTAMGGLPESSEPKRIRTARAPRSRSGCRTCRIRHVKCNELPGRCLNCVSTGRQCDGYDLDRLPLKKKGPAPSTPLSVHRMRSVLPDQTSDEGRCFSLFQGSTIPMMNVLFDHHMWERLTPQMSHAEPAICHASSLHLISRTNSNNPSVKNKVLIYCLLFVVFELTHGRYDLAIVHLQNGVKLLGAESQRPIYSSLYHTHPSSAVERHIELSFAAAIMDLDLQSAHFGVSKLHEGLDLDMFVHQVGHPPSMVDYQASQDVWIVRDRIFIQLLTGKERRALAGLRMHHAVLSVTTDICLIKCSETIRSISTERFNDAIDQTKTVTGSLMEIAPRNTPRCPTLLMETRTIAPLFFVIVKCDNLGVRHRALEDLESWPHREDLWDLELAVTLARQMMCPRVH